MASRSGEMRNLLKGVSRSFYLTLRILPHSIYAPLSIAYLLARATDTIADTNLVDISRRRQMLLDFREIIFKTCEGQSCPAPEFGDLAQATQARVAERELLAKAARVLDCLRSLENKDRLLVRSVLEIIIRGQEMDLIRFGAASPDKIASLETDSDLDEYTYCVAGCVGEFWTNVCCLHLLSGAHLKETALLANGIRFGKGLQLVNILRDLPKDLHHGRCYIPADRLFNIGMKPQDLLESAAIDRFRPLYNNYLQLAEEHLCAGWEYVGMLPFRQLRVRLACAWPLLIGIKTLARLKAENVLDDRHRVKISRSEIRRMIFQSIVAYPFPSVWDHMFYSLLK
jgi:farnesyl-diphosphate farnesyltransferase